MGFSDHEAISLLSSRLVVAATTGMAATAEAAAYLGHVESRSYRQKATG